MSLFSTLRSMVSGHDKNRFTEGSYDLDLTYITPRIIAMSYPAEGIETSWRNDIQEVKRFLEEKHGPHYQIYNLTERHYNYALLDGKVASWCGWPDHHAPPLALLFRVLASMHHFLMMDERNVVSVHCRAGKGRTGTVVACYLLFCGLFGSASPALNYFAAHRSSNMFGVTSPSQRRSVLNCADIFQNRSIPPTPSFILRSVTFSELPRLEVGNDDLELRLSVEVWDVTVATAHRLLFRSEARACSMGEQQVVFPVTCLLHADVQVNLCYAKPGIFSGHKTRPVCFVQFHTVMATSRMLFPKHEVDKAWSDKRFSTSFSMEVLLEPVELEKLRCAQEDPESDALGNILVPGPTPDGGTPFFPEKRREQVQAARAFSSPEARQTEKAGYLIKQGLTFKTWKNRWFVLRPECLAYYKQPRDARPAGEITLSSMWTVKLMRDKRVDPSQPEPHSLVLRTEGRDYVLCSRSVLELEEWKEALEHTTMANHKSELESAPQFGKLFCVVIGAQNLFPNPFSGDVNPYCVAALGRQKYTTPTDAQNGGNPFWAPEVFSFNVSREKDTLQLSVWDDVPSFADRFCGLVSLHLETMRKFRKPTPVWLELGKRTALSVVSGHLHALLYYCDTGDPKAVERLDEHVEFMRTQLPRNRSVGNLMDSFEDVKPASSPRSDDGPPATTPPKEDDGPSATTPPKEDDGPPATTPPKEDDAAPPSDFVLL